MCLSPEPTRCASEPPPRVHHATRWHGSGVAARGASAAGGDAGGGRGARLMMSIVVAGAGVEPSYPERVVGAQPGPTRRSALPAGLLAPCRTHGETLRIGGVHETGVAGLARITIQLDLGRRSLTVPPPSRRPCRSRWEARRFEGGA